MRQVTRRYRIFFIALIVTALVVSAKYALHSLALETISLGSLHSSLISGVIFVLGFLMSATIADYKEAERIPAEVASAIENMKDDVKSIGRNYPEFDTSEYLNQLKNVATSFTADVRDSKNQRAQAHLTKLMELNADMENAGVPANFIVKLKQQQAVVTRHLYRVRYIQRITFIPSAGTLAWSIVVLAIGLLLFTEVEPFFAGLILTGGITYILVYVLQLLRVIRTPFHDEGKTQDDVSLFLLDKLKNEK